MSTVIAQPIANTPPRVVLAPSGRMFMDPQMRPDDTAWTRDDIVSAFDHAGWLHPERRAHFTPIPEGTLVQNHYGVISRTDSLTIPPPWRTTTHTAEGNAFLGEMLIFSAVLARHAPSFDSPTKKVLQTSVDAALATAWTRSHAETMRGALGDGINSIINFGFPLNASGEHGPAFIHDTMTVWAGAPSKPWLLLEIEGGAWLPWSLEATLNSACDTLRNYPGLAKGKFDPEISRQMFDRCVSGYHCEYTVAEQTLWILNHAEALQALKKDLWAAFEINKTVEWLSPAELKQFASPKAKPVQKRAKKKAHPPTPDLKHDVEECASPVSPPEPQKTVVKHLKATATQHIPIPVFEPVYWLQHQLGLPGFDGKGIIHTRVWHVDDYVGLARPESSLTELAIRGQWDKRDGRTPIGNMLFHTLRHGSHVEDYNDAVIGALSHITTHAPVPYTLHPLYGSNQLQGRRYTTQHMVLLTTDAPIENARIITAYPRHNDPQRHVQKVEGSMGLVLDPAQAERLLIHALHL